MSRKLFDKFIAGNRRGWREQKNAREASDGIAFIKNGLRGWRILLFPDLKYVKFQYYDPQEDYEICDCNDGFEGPNPDCKTCKGRGVIPVKEYWGTAEAYDLEKRHKELLKDIDNLVFHDYPPYFKGVIPQPK